MEKIIPLRDYLTLEHIKEENILILPGTADNALSKGDFIVKGLGKDCKEIKIGDKVIVNKGGVLKIKIKDDDVLFTKEEYVSLVIRKEGN